MYILYIYIYYFDIIVIINIKLNKYCEYCIWDYCWIVTIYICI